jgi:hypothetical protein
MVCGSMVKVVPGIVPFPGYNASDGTRYEPGIAEVNLQLFFHSDWELSWAILGHIGGHCIPVDLDIQCTVRMPEFFGDGLLAMQKVIQSRSVI